MQNARLTGNLAGAERDPPKSSTFSKTQQVVFLLFTCAEPPNAVIHGNQRNRNVHILGAGFSADLGARCQ